MREPYQNFLGRLRAQLLGERATLPVAVRRDILEGRILDDTLNAFVVRVRADARSVTDDDVAKLRAAGFDEDAIFEAAVCAAYFAGAERYHAAMRALAEAGDAP